MARLGDWIAEQFTSQQDSTLTTIFISAFRGDVGQHMQRNQYRTEGSRRATRAVPSVGVNDHVVRECIEHHQIHQGSRVHPSIPRHQEQVSRIQMRGYALT